MIMRNDEYIKVLWVENDPEIINSYPRDAETLPDARLDLRAFSSWEEAKEALNADYNQWKAIILDAKCKYSRVDDDKATKFLSRVIPEIQEFERKYNRFIPWYILTGEGEDEIRELISPIRQKWDGQWDRLSNRPFYSKNGSVKWGGEPKQDYLVLFQRIRTFVEHYDHEIQLEKHLYPDVFSSIARLEANGLDVQASGFLVNLLEPIHFHTTTPVDYNRRYLDLRKFLELIFRHMVDKAILPSFMRTVTKTKDEINLSWSSKFLGEKFKDNDELWKHITRNTPDSKPLLPKQLGDLIKEAVFQAGGAAHTSQAEVEINMNLDKYLPTVCNSPYMLRSLALAMCDFVLWYDNYYASHSDKDENTTLWTILDNNNHIR